jgi:hypothetical protein
MHVPKTLKELFLVTLPTLSSIKNSSDMHSHSVNPLYPSSELPATACKDAPISNATRDWSGGPRACVLVTRSEENANEENANEEEERDIIVTVLLPLASFPTTDGRRKFGERERARESSRNAI